MNDIGTARGNWTQTPEAFEKFLTWLDDGTDSEGRSYLEMRRRLAAYFDRKHCLRPDELADETLIRVSRRLEEEGSIDAESPAHFCYITARYVFLESFRKEREMALPLDDARVADSQDAMQMDSENGISTEKLLSCLDTCTSKLDDQSRSLIYGYYLGKGREKIDNRRSLAQKMGISVNALTIKACRIRTRLEACVGKCAGIQ